jgi:hypothetical protein
MYAVGGFVEAYNLEVFEFLGKIFYERFFWAEEQFREELIMMKFCSSVVVCSKAIDKSHLPQMHMFATFPCEPITIFPVRLLLSIHMSMLVKVE